MDQRKVNIRHKGAERARKGHLWIYRSDVLDFDGITPGSIVRVLEEGGRYVGQAFFSDRSEITLRLLTTRNEVIDRNWWRARLQACVRRRVEVAKSSNAYRLVYSEGDLLPSLILDVYDDVFVLQTLSQGTDRLKELFVELLIEEFAPRAIIERNDVKVRALEGLQMSVGILHGDPPDEVLIEQHGVRFAVAPLAGQKTGSFLDQRENRDAAAGYAHGRGLDCFTFNGAFALHMARACEAVLAIDISDDAIASAKRNATLNSAHNIEFRTANVFDQLREFEAKGTRFDTIVLDPPAFAKNRASVKAALRGYKEINLRAMKLLEPGGILITCTCSYHMSEAMFIGLLSDAAADARRRVQLVEKTMQSKDHPVLFGMPETHYLKCVFARMLD